jgi:peptidoglycan-associated lipoprotein
MQRIATLVGLMALALFATACPPSYPNCKSDENCKEQGEVCVQGQCRECATDAQCKEGFRCEANRCVPKGGCAKDADCGQGMKCQAGACVVDPSASAPEDEGAGRASCDLEPIRFEFNKHSLSDPAKARLAEIADCLKKQKGTVTLEGHADERGTEEYNLQLSNRRAASVKSYLSALGVPEKKLDTVGFGENRPASQGSGEDAWATNRRVEIRE